MPYPLLLSLVLAMPIAAAPAKITPEASLRQEARARPQTATPSASPQASAQDPTPPPLQPDLDRLIQRAEWPDDEWSVLVVSLENGDTLYAHDPDRPLAPASNMKLFTSAAALYYLGPDYRYPTYLLTDGTVRNGVLRGDLILYGTGDPTLSDRFYGSKLAVWEEFAEELSRLGITEIQGDIVGDASYFDGPGTGIGWRERYMNAWFAAPASALSFHDNVVTLHVTPGEQEGWRPEIQLVPGGRGIAIVNQATTAPGGARVAVDRAGYDGPILVTGQIRPGHSGIWRSVPVADPARYAATVFNEVLEANDIRVHGAVRSVQRAERSAVTNRQTFAPTFDGHDAPRVLAVHRSRRLLDILSVVNKESHNLYAELVLRTVGRIAQGDGSVRGGARAVRTLLTREAGLDTVALRMLDGSGLSPLNFTDAGTVIGLLAFMAETPVHDAFQATLPTAGTAGGLRRMYHTNAAGNLRAKTGTIDSVSALSGYVRAANGEPLAFSIISNSVPSTWRAKRVEDAIGARIAAFDRPRRRPVPAGSGTAAGATAALTPSGSTPANANAVQVRDSAASADAPRIYLVRRGDTLEGIARRHGTTVRALREANPDVRPRRLLPGQAIILP